MINLKNIKNQKISDTKLLEALFYTFPLSFIVGNLIVSMHFLLFIIISLVYIKKHNLDLRFNKLNFLPTVFFLYIIASTIIQFPNIFEVFAETLNIEEKKIPLESDPIFKSFLLIRFIILIIIVDTLFFNKILKFEKIFIFSLFCTSFVSMDIIIQSIIGYDIFGFPSLENGTNIKNSGPFGEEHIAGGYIQKFSFISFFSIYFINLKNKNLNKILLISIIVLHAVAILLAGNRMPMILFLFGCFIIIFFVKNFRFIMFLSIIIFSSIFFIISANNQSIKKSYISFYNDIEIFSDIKKKYK